MSGEICTDNRFEIIAAYKKNLIKGTNIESSPEEMAVIDNVLFRFWQMGWLLPMPHGRLINADALADVFRGFIAMYDSCPFSQLAPTDKARRDELQTALAEVINAPTIIPAEEGET